MHPALAPFTTVLRLSHSPPSPCLPATVPATTSFTVSYARDLADDTEHKGSLTSNSREVGTLNADEGELMSCSKVGAAGNELCGRKRSSSHASADLSLREDGLKRVRACSPEHEVLEADDDDGDDCDEDRQVEPATEAGSQRRRGGLPADGLLLASRAAAGF